LGPVFDKYERIQDSYVKYYEKFNEPTKTFVKSIASISAFKIRDHLDSFSDLILSLPHQQPIVDTSNKRRNDIGLSFSLGTYNAHQITQLDAKISAQKHKADLLVNIEDLHDNHLQRLNQRLNSTTTLLTKLPEAAPEYVAHVFDALEKNLQYIHSVCDKLILSAQIHRLAPGVLPLDVLLSILKHALAVSQHQNFINFINHPSDFFQMESSFLFNPSENIFTIILHIPFVQKQNMLELHEFIPIPVAFNFTANFSMTPDVRKNNLLAIRNNQTFKTLSSTDLQSCRRLGDTFFCKGMRVFQTDLRQSCLGSLFLGHAVSVRENCRFQITNAKEQIFDIDDNMWAVYTTGTISTNQICPATGSVEPLQIQSGQVIKIKTGCYVRTMEHIISADEYKDLTLSTQRLERKWNVEELFPDINEESLQRAIMELHLQGKSDFGAADLINHLDKTCVYPDHWVFTSPAIMIGVVLILGLLATLTWKHKCKKVNKSEPTSLTRYTAPSPTTAVLYNNINITIC